MHVLSDALGSLAVVVGAIITYLTDWLWVDPLLAILLSAVILRWSVRLLLDSGHVLLEGTPRHIKVEKIVTELKGIDGRVTDVEDLHVWEITSGMPMLSAHVLVGPDADCHAIRSELELLLRSEFEIGHTTLQVEHTSRQEPIQIDDLTRPDG